MSDFSSSAPDVEPDVSTQDVEEQEPYWQRLLYMLGFWFLGNIAFSLSILAGGVQFVFILIAGDRNEELARFSQRLVRYVYECLGFIVYRTNDKPFPFGPFPEADKVDDD